MLFSHEPMKDYIYINMNNLITADFAAGAVLITLGALLGKCTIKQLFILSIFEIIFYSINEAIGNEIFHASDMGGSMYVHTFGAYFGIAASFFFYRR